MNGERGTRESTSLFAYTHKKETEPQVQSPFFRCMCLLIIQLQQQFQLR